MKHFTQRGATLIEFALGLLIFLMFFLSIVDFSRMLYTWGVANEAARAGARYAVVCDDMTRSDLVLAHMQHRLPKIQSIEVKWEPPGCGLTSCQQVTVKIKDLEFDWIAPIVGSVVQKIIGMPEFATTLPREVMHQDPVVNASPECTP